jgi:hypothetical protein
LLWWLGLLVFVVVVVLLSLARMWFAPRSGR